jgi:uncharacterized protein (TIGR00369 family)
MMPFAAGLGVSLDGASAQEVTGRLSFSEDLCTAGGILHGGALMALADTLGGICAYLNLPEGAGTATVSSNTSFLRPVRGGEVSGRTEPLHIGRSTIVVQTTLRDDDGRAVSHTTQVQAVLAPSSP